MKKTLFIAGMMLATVGAQAQFKVYNNGNIGINAIEDEETGAPISQVSVNAPGVNRTEVHLRTNNCGMIIGRTGSPTVNYNWWSGIEINMPPVSGNFNLGIKSRSVASTPMSTARTYGLWGEAGNATHGYNYGVFGRLVGERDGAGIYGIVGDENGTKVDGQYAGFFEGDVKVTGILYAPHLTTVAASANNATILTTMTANSSNTSVAENLSQLSTIQYSMNYPVATTSTLAEGDTIDTQTFSATEIQAMQKSHYGLVAAQLRQVYPDLVYENQNGELCINYIEMIPLLVQSINELNARLEAQENVGGAVVMSRAISGATSVEEATALTIPMLKQNNPNPFTENTVIEYTLPETVQTANIYIYDMNGSQIEQIALTERGEASITVNGGQLSAGMYLYSLIADGKVIDTKRMILTK